LPKGHEFGAFEAEIVLERLGGGKEGVGNG
jgi:hypothetical protein